MSHGGKYIACLYKSFRPVYPPELVQRILHFIKSKNPEADFKTALDVGCGNGQLTGLLAPFYTDVHGTDPDAKQIEEGRAESANNVTFSVGKAENLDYEDQSIDLITAGQCIHWFDASKFYLEVKRVLKPKGTLAIVTYGNPVIESRKGEEISGKMTEISDSLFAFFRDNKYMDPRAVESKFRGHLLKVPFDDVEKDSSIFMIKNSSIEDYVGFIESTSHYSNYLEANPSGKLLERITKDLCDVSQSSKKDDILLKYPLDLTMACVH